MYPENNLVKILADKKKSQMRLQKGCLLQIVNTGPIVHSIGK